MSKKMLGKIVCGLITLVAIGLGVYEYYGPWGLSCHPGFYKPHSYLATKTPYSPPSSTPSQPHKGSEKCEALQVWMVVRHGTRYPSAKVIKKMINLLPTVRDQIVKSHRDGKGSLCTEELDILSKWNPPPSLAETEEKKLVAQGETELRGIANRLRKKFPTLFQKKYDNETYEFKFTKTERTEASAKHFVHEILGDEDAPRVKYPEAVHADPVLRFYKGCAKWKKEVDKNPDSYLERIRFEKSEMFQSLLKRTQERCGFDSPMPVEVVEAIYMTCAFETAWTPLSPSPWCHLFDEEDLRIMEYRQDIEYYWIDGYGYELTYKQACPAVQDLIRHISAKVENSEEGPSLIAYFTHSGTTLKLVSRFGLFNDSTPLLHNNYHLHTNRKWRTSIIDKFATNIAFVLYNCSGTFKVGMLFQEESIHIPIPGCSHKDLCPFNTFLAHYDSIVNDCDMPLMCNL